jgi:CDP-paratose synthetase
MAKKTTILITGGTGYLGSVILKKLAAIGYHIVLLKRSSSNTFRIAELLGSLKTYDIDKTPLEKVFLENHIDIILHCATDYGKKNVEPLQIIDANLILPLRLLELGKTGGISCFINTDTILDKRVSHYSLSKRQFNDWLQAYKSYFSCVNIALEHFFGAGDDKTKFVSFIIDELLKNAAKIDLTPGKQLRDFVYIDDVVSGFLLIIKKCRELEAGYFKFEIGSGNLISIKEFVIKIKELTGNSQTKLNFGAVPYRDNEVMRYGVDLTAIKNLGWKCENSLEQGLKKTINLSL